MRASCKAVSLNGQAIIEVQGEVAGVGDCICVSSAVRKGLSENPDGVVLDLTEVSFITASFCGFLASSLKDAQQQGRKLEALVLPDSEVHEVLRAVGMEKLIRLWIPTMGPKTRSQKS